MAGDAKTEGDEVYEEVFAAYPFRPGRILDVGCAWGRMFPLFIKCDLQVSGVDISDAMIEQCREAWAGKPMIEAIETVFEVQVTGEIDHRVPVRGAALLWL